MAEPTLSDVFGSNATQDATTVTISKADLTSVGLTASASNTAESLLASVLLLAKEGLTQSVFDTNLDQSIVIENGFNSLVQRDDGTGTFVEYRQTQLNVNMHSLDAFAIDPNSF